MIPTIINIQIPSPKPLTAPSRQMLPLMQGNFASPDQLLISPGHAGAEPEGEGFPNLLQGLQQNFGTSAPFLQLVEIMSCLLGLLMQQNGHNASPSGTGTASRSAGAPMARISDNFLGLTKNKNSGNGASIEAKPASASPRVQSNDTPAGSSPIGMKARSHGVDYPATNPNNGSSDWNTWCLGWVNQAIQAAGGGAVPELQAEDAQAAYEKALAAGKIRTGNPPPGAIVFFPGIVNPANGKVWGHVGIANPDGKTYRGTVPASENPKTIGDRPIKDLANIPWMMPEGTLASSGDNQGANSPQSSSPTSSSGNAQTSSNPDWASKLPEPLRRLSPVFEKYGKQYGVDPRFLAAVSMFETANGTSSAFLNKNNAMGVSNSNGPVGFSAVEQSIEQMARVLASSTGPYKGARTVNEIGQVYAPVGASNDPNNTNGHWPKGVAACYRQLGGDPSKPVK